MLPKQSARMLLKLSASSTEKTYEQILDLLEELVLHAAEEEIDSVDDEDDKGPDHEIVLENIVELAGERGLDEEQVERIFRGINVLVRKA